MSLRVYDKKKYSILHYFELYTANNADKRHNETELLLGKTRQNFVEYKIVNYLTARFSEPLSELSMNKIDWVNCKAELN